MRHAVEAQQLGAEGGPGECLGRSRPCGTLRLEPGNRLVTRRIEQEPPALHEEHPLREPERPGHALLREHDRGSVAGHDVEEARSSLRIELRGGLVEEQEPRALRERRREANALQLAARQLDRPAPPQVQHADRRQRLLHARPDLVRGRAQVLEAEGDLVLDARHDDLVLRILEDRRHRASQLCGPRSSRVEAADLDRAGEAPAVEVRHEPGQRADERRLAGAGRAEHGDDLAGLDRQRHVDERSVRARVAVREPVDAG
jgi:hypothetical protein